MTIFLILFSYFCVGFIFSSLVFVFQTKIGNTNLTPKYFYMYDFMANLLFWPIVFPLALISVLLDRYSKWLVKMQQKVNRNK